MLIGIVAGVVVALAVAVGAFGLTRIDSRTRPWLLGASAVLLAIGVGGIGVWLWARTATDTSQMARTLVWGDSAYGDQGRFPARMLEASADPVRFESVSDSPVTAYVNEGGTTLLDLLEQTETTAFIVLNRDTVIYEGYFNGSDRKSLQTSFSVAKSFIATLIGIAIDEGLLTGLDEPVTNQVPELLQRDARFGDITLRHLLTMSSGLSFEEGSSPWADPANTYHGTDLREAAVTRPVVVEPPGAKFHYNDWNVILLGLVLERATGMSVGDYTESRLWQPMGAEADGSWSLDSQQRGFEKMFVGVNGRAIDFTKLGWVYLNQGRNGANQVVPADFVAEATATDVTSDPASGYQYLWWIDEANQSYYANGDHGQFIYVDPGAELVLVRNGRSGDHDWLPVFAELSDWLEPQLSGT